MRRPPAGPPTAPTAFTLYDGEDYVLVTFTLPSPAAYDSLWYRLYEATGDADAAFWVKLGEGETLVGFGVTPPVRGVYK